MVKSLLFIGVLAWLSAAVGGGICLVWYQSQPGAESLAYPSTFPTESRLHRDLSYPTLIFFAHPKCPCTKASLHELERLLTDVDGKLNVYFVITKPPGAPDDWTTTDLRSGAEAIPNVEVVIDDDEKISKEFGARTSGLTLLYDRNGILQFDGGITSSRGHEGANAGRRTIYEIVTNENSELKRTPVYGCPLRSDDCDGIIINDAQ